MFSFWEFMVIICMAWHRIGGFFKGNLGFCVLLERAAYIVMDKDG